MWMLNQWLFLLWQCHSCWRGCSDFSVMVVVVMVVVVAVVAVVFKAVLAAFHFYCVGGAVVIACVHLLLVLQPIDSKWTLMFLTRVNTPLKNK